MLNSEEIIRGERVDIRRFTRKDITPDYINWLNDPRVVRYSNQRFRVHTTETCIRYFEFFSGTPSLFLKIVPVDSDQKIGTMTAHISPHHGTADMGILIGDTSRWGEGLGSDAWVTLLGWLLIQGSARKVTGGCLSSNKAMIRIMESSGMTLEAIRPRQELVDGIPLDLLYFGKFRA